MLSALRRLFSSTAAAVTDTGGSPLKLLLQETKSIKGVVRYSKLQDQEVLHRESSKPLVVLVGWTHARQEHMGKYAAVYQKLGYPTLSLAPSVFHTLNIYSSDRYSKKVSTVLNNSYSGPFILHLFSGASTILLPRFTQLAKKFENIQLKGVIFDCGPSKFTKEAAIAAVKQIFFPPALTYYAAYSCFVFSAMVRGTKMRKELDETFKRPVLSVPQLCLYSDIDPVLPVASVENYMEKQKGLGRDVEGILFKGATHVRLLQAEPDKYTEQIKSFLQKIN